MEIEWLECDSLRMQFPIFSADMYLDSKLILSIYVRQNTKVIAEWWLLVHSEYKSGYGLNWFVFGAIERGDMVS